MLLRILGVILVFTLWCSGLNISMSIANTKMPFALGLGFICFILVTWTSTWLLTWLLSQPITNLFDRFNGGGSDKD